MKEINSLDELKRIELEIMKKIHSFCVDNHISYCLAYGTLIGAMRHQGFIPWDDDIDIWMLREDYNRFLELFPKHQDELELKVVNHKTDIYFGRPMSKIIDTRTILTEPEYKYDDPIGVFIDIWPLDNLPENELERTQYIKQIRHQLRKLYGCISNKKLQFNSFASIKNSLKILAYRNADPKRIVDRIEELSTKYSNIDTKYVSNSTFSYEIFKRESFENMFLSKFEDTEFYCPSGYDEVLTIHYGDWRTLPPKDKQIPHHVIDVYWKD